jgi:glycosyl hydrolase family 9/cellulase-like Ig domain-containing protein
MAAMEVARFLAALSCTAAILLQSEIRLPGAEQGLVQPTSLSPDRGEDSEALNLPPVGWHQLRVLAPALLELTLVTTSGPAGAPGAQWNFVNTRGECSLPALASFAIRSSNKTIAVQAVGFKRRVLYAPLKPRDLRIANQLYLKLERNVEEGQAVDVTNPDGKLWGSDTRFRCAVEPFRLSPVLHVNQTGYLRSQPKTASVGYFLGSLGEMDIETAVPGGLAFSVLDVASGREAFHGLLSPRPDRGFPYPCYQRVFEADFSTLTNSGRYRLFVPGLGTSFSFLIDDAVAGAFARTYALGIYHQRCGAASALPFTRFTHEACHTAPAEVPDMSNRFKSANESLFKESSNFKNNPRHTAPQLKNVSASLYPFVRRGPLDVRGGHHDAGDYSKYTINSAAFIHHLVLAADAFPGVSDLDNLGLPESGDGKSDVLQEAKWEADFLARLQDDDGGFYFLVYPRGREYETDVLPDHGDPQIVFPKTTAATAAAVAALAQCASSPVFKKQFPEAAAGYLEHARKGWSFLERAITRFGKDGAYQKITHYGDQFMHDDELAWAACEMFLATRQPEYHQKLREWLNPSDPAMRRWGWWRLYDSFGCAIRSYAFAARTGRVTREALNPALLEGCENEIAAAGEDQLRRVSDSAYGTSFPRETKQVFSAGWYFSGDAAFDLAVACQLDYSGKRDPRRAMRDAIISNLNYEQGGNPVNVTYLTGLGWKRQREIVHQYAQNDRRILPPTGVPLGNIQGGLGWNYVYQKEPEALSFPPDAVKESPYPFYDRWSDGFNLSQEFVIVNQARSLGYLCWLMAETPLKIQPWKAVAGKINHLNSGGVVEVSLSVTATDIDLSSARIIWEAEGMQPGQGNRFELGSGVPAWVEAEAQLPDGRRIFAEASGR